MNVDYSKFGNRLIIYTAVGVIWTLLGVIYVLYGFPRSPYESPSFGYPLHSVLYWLSIGGLLVLVGFHFIPLLSILGLLLNIGLTALIGEPIYWLRKKKR